MKKLGLILLATFISFGSYSQDLSSFPLTEEWISEIAELAPESTTIETENQKDILIFSLHTGYEHWTIPHTEAVVKLIAEQSGAFTVSETKDVTLFTPETLAQYDVVVLNNNCSKPEKRDLFWDALESINDEAKRKAKALEFENNLIGYVRDGGGLVILHGGIVMQNKSSQFSEMVGGSFDYHPKQQNIKVKLVDPNHPLVMAFGGKGFEHVDEPYFFNGAYNDYNFRPLLYMEVKELDGVKNTDIDNIRYISWIKTFGEGRIFYSSPSHNAQSYKNPDLLRFLLDGMQYAAGDLECDDEVAER